MKVNINISVSKIFGLVKADIRGNLNISHSGGSFIYNRLKKTILRSLTNKGYSGSVSIDGETMHIER